MTKAIRWSLVAIVVLALGGAAAGYFTAPRYRPPAQSDEARLRARAASFYRAAFVLDYQTMTELYTPAHQQAEAASLRQQAKEKQLAFRSFKAETRSRMQRSAEAVSREQIEVQREGDWAVTKGTSVLYDGDQQIPYPLEELVWLRTSGDWWIYQRKNSELLAYGNPPDFALQLLERQSQGIDSSSMIDLEALQRGEAAAAENGSAAPAEVEGASPPADNQDEGPGDE